jgi:hypothetical protein
MGISVLQLSTVVWYDDISDDSERIFQGGGRRLIEVLSRHLPRPPLR